MFCSLASAPPWLQDIDKPWTNVQNQCDLSGQVSGWIENVYVDEWVITLNLRGHNETCLGCNK